MSELYEPSPPCIVLPILLVHNTRSFVTNSATVIDGF